MILIQGISSSDKEVKKLFGTLIKLSKGKALKGVFHLRMQTKHYQVLNPTEDYLMIIHNLTQLTKQKNEYR